MREEEQQRKNRLQRMAAFFASYMTDADLTVEEMLWVLERANKTWRTATNHPEQ